MNEIISAKDAIIAIFATGAAIGMGIGVIWAFISVFGRAAPIIAILAFAAFLYSM